LLLLIFGLHGRREARGRAPLDDLAGLRQQLRLALEKETRVLEPAGVGEGPMAPGPVEDAAIRRDGVVKSLGRLRGALRQFDLSDQVDRRTDEDWEIRLARAALANGERRYRDTTNILGGDGAVSFPASWKGEEWAAAAVEARADAFYGLRDWETGLRLYQRLLAGDGQNLGALSRVATCHWGLGQSNEARGVLHDLAAKSSRAGDQALQSRRSALAADYYSRVLRVHGVLMMQNRGPDSLLEEMFYRNKRAQARLLNGEADWALADLEAALQIPSRSGDTVAAGPIRTKASSSQACSQMFRGSIWLTSARLEQAANSFDQAITNLTTLTEGHGVSSLRGELGLAYQRRGTALLGLGRTDSAVVDFTEAIGRLEPLEGSEDEANWAVELSRSLNNRGVAHRIAGRPEAAIADFDRARQVLDRRRRDGTSPLVSAGQPPAAAKTADGMDDCAVVSLDVTMAYAENALEAFVRTRLRSDVGAGERPLLGICLKNRGSSRLTKRELKEASTDFQQAVTALRTFVYEEGERDLTLQLAKALSALAWVKATAVEPVLRDGPEAFRLANEACDITDGKLFVALDALAASYAELGRFGEAMDRQRKALELTPPKLKAVLDRRLEEYKAGIPHRSNSDQTSPAGLTSQ
jgi:tetratricopeptide (TPR) repeat protein